MDRIDRERFGRLRNHLAKTPRDAAWRNALCFMLLRAYKEHPQMYQGMWVAYLSGLRGIWDAPLRLLGTPQDLRTWSEVAPFALFDVSMPDRIGRDNMHTLCTLPIAMRIRTLTLVRNKLRPRDIRKLAESTQLGRVERLDLSGNALAHEDVVRMLASPNWPGLTEVHFDQGNVPQRDQRLELTEEFGRAGDLRIHWR